MSPPLMRKPTTKSTQFLPRWFGIARVLGDVGGDINAEAVHSLVGPQPQRVEDVRCASSGLAAFWREQVEIPLSVRRTRVHASPPNTDCQLQTGPPVLLLRRPLWCDVFQDVHGIADAVLGCQGVADLLRPVTVCRVVDQGVQTISQTVDAEPAHR